MYHRAEHQGQLEISDPDQNLGFNFFFHQLCKKILSLIIPSSLAYSWPYQIKSSVPSISINILCHTYMFLSYRLFQQNIAKYINHTFSINVFWNQQKIFVSDHSQFSGIFLPIPNKKLCTYNRIYGRSL